MEYLVEMTLADSARSTTPAEGVAFIEQFVLPTLEVCQTLEAEHRIVAGGPLSGATALALIVRAESAQELDTLIQSLPIWHRMQTVVTPLTSFAARAKALRPRLERLKAGMSRGLAGVPAVVEDPHA